MTFLGEASASFQREFRHHSALPPWHQQIHNHVIDEHRLKQYEPVCELNSFRCCQIVQRNKSCCVSMHTRKGKKKQVCSDTAGAESSPELVLSFQLGQMQAQKIRSE
jgi:hypothetical protein